MVRCAHQDVETRVTKDGADTGQYLWDLTRALSTIPYKVPLCDDLLTLDTPRWAIFFRAFPFFAGIMRALVPLCLEEVCVPSKIRESILSVHWKKSTAFWRHPPSPSPALPCLAVRCARSLKDDVTELHCVPRFKTRARGSENLAEDDQKLADTWVSARRSHSFCLFVPHSTYV